jgi:hypothetical protein
MPRPAWEEESTQPPPGQQVSRARAIFEASDEAKPFDPADFDFAMADEEAPVDAVTPAEENASTIDSVSSPAPQRKRVLGMTPVQLGVVGALVVALLILLAVFAYLLLTSILP